MYNGTDGETHSTTSSSKRTPWVVPAPSKLHKYEDCARGCLEYVPFTRIMVPPDTNAFSGNIDIIRGDGLHCDPYVPSGHLEGVKEGVSVGDSVGLSDDELDGAKVNVRDTDGRFEAIDEVGFTESTVVGVRDDKVVGATESRAGDEDGETEFEAFGNAGAPLGTSDGESEGRLVEEPPEGVAVGNRDGYLERNPV